MFFYLYLSFFPKNFKQKQQTKNDSYKRKQTNNHNRMADERLEPNQYPQFHERDDTIGVSDQFEMITKFAMEQNLAHYGYGEKLNHINKNLLFTNLKTQHEEPQRIIRQLQNITILKRFVVEKEVAVPTGEYETIEDAEGNIFYRPIYVVQKQRTYRFNNTIDYSSTLVYGITSTAAGRDAKLIEMLRSTFLHKEQSIEDKTDTKKGTWFAPKKR